MLFFKFWILNKRFKWDDILWLGYVYVSVGGYVGDKKKIGKRWVCFWKYVNVKDGRICIWYMLYLEVNNCSYLFKKNMGF